MYFFYPIHIPSLNSTRHFKEFTCVDYKAFIKIILNNDDDVYELFIDELIADLCRDDLDVSKLTNFDKFIIMVEIRTYNISPTIEFTIPKADKEKYEFKINLMECLDVARSYKLQHSFNIDMGKLKVCCTLPKNLVIKDWFDVGINCITSIEFNGNKIPVSDLDKNIQAQIMNQLPAPIFPKILQQFKAQADIMLKECLIKMPSAETPGEFQEVYISPIDNTMSEIIKMIYNYNLKDIYAGQLALMSQLKIPDTFINSSTPAELSIYFSIIEEQAAKEKAEGQQQQDGSQTIVPPQGID
jgi:hypothetical protein